MWCIKVFFITSIFTLAKSQLVINNDANSNFFSVAMPHAQMSFQRYFGGDGGQKLALQIQQPHTAGLYETPLTHTQQLQQINHAHIPAHYHHFTHSPQIRPQIYHQSAAPHATHQNIIKFSPSSEVSSVTYSSDGINYNF